MEPEVPECLVAPASRLAWVVLSAELSTVAHAEKATGRYGQHLVRACLDAAYTANLNTRACIGLDIDHATEALRVLDAPPESRRRVHARLTALHALGDKLERQGDELLERLKGLDGALGIPRRPTWAPTPAPQATP